MSDYSELERLLNEAQDPKWLESLPLEQKKEAVALLDELTKRKLLNYRPYAKQVQFHAEGALRRERLFRAGNQLGKAQPIDELVLTPRGWVEIGKLNIGDIVIAGDGTKTKVLKIHPQGEKEVFRVTFDDGATTRCCEDHLWTARIKKIDRFGKNKNGEWPVYSLKEIREWGGDNPRPEKRAVIPVAHRAEFDPQDINIDPYLLGVLLGDGCLRNGSVSFTTADNEIIENVKSVIPNSCTVVKRGKYGYFISDLKKRPTDRLGRFSSHNELKARLVSLGVYGKMSYEKFVPKNYLFNIDKIRLGILQGLMDTDGSVSKDGAIEFSSTSWQLAQDVIFLARSFGGKVKIEERQTYAVKNGDRKAGRISWRLRIRLPHVPVFRLKRKLERCFKPVSTTDHRVLYKIEPAGISECVCISVGHISQTYITNDFIVTHNSLSGAAECAIHLTGRYPGWWTGKRFSKPTAAWAGGVTGEVTRDTIQRLLIGSIGMEGSGFLTKADIIEVVPARGIAGLADTILVRHISGGVSRIRLKFYEQGREKWQAETLDFIWFDEEPPEDVYVEGLTRTNATGGMVYLTFTPLLGMSTVVRRFFNEQSVDRADINMTIDDVGHISAEQKKRIIDSYPAHEREARIRGTPMLGSGRIFPIAEEAIKVKRFEIPAWYHRIGGLDFGWDHPTAACDLAYNADMDIIYVTKVYKKSEATPMVHCSALRSWGANLNWAWPHDGLQHDKGSGVTLAEQYRREGLNMLPDRATFPDGSNGVEAGLMEMLTRMENGTLKVFEDLELFFEEFRLYHRKDGKVVKEFDDVISACLHPDSEIITRNGVKRIADLVGTSGDVLSVNGTWQQYRNCRMTKKNAELVRVVFSDGHELLCTPDHRLLSRNGEWIEAIDSKGMMCAVASNGWQNTLSVLRVENVSQRSDVYCLEVPTTEAFALANGAIVHNCRYALMMIRFARQIAPKGDGFGALFNGGGHTSQYNALAKEHIILDTRSTHTVGGNPLSRDRIRSS